MKIKQRILFPLTPALSLRERETSGPVLRQFEPPQLFKRPAAIPPLPEGEVRGEGQAGSCRQPCGKENHTEKAFTLLELLAVIAIIGIIAAIALPSLKGMRPNIQASAARQLLDDVNRARQLAISQRTDVYMVFCPQGYWTSNEYSNLKAPVETAKADRLAGKQLIGYTFVSLRGVGDQPGRPTARYWSNWKTLPQGSFIPLEKFAPRNQYVDIYTSAPPVLAYRIYGFSTTNTIPFPSEDAVTNRNNTSTKNYVTVPYIGFNYLGQLISGRNELIPLARGGVNFARDPNTGGVPPQTFPSVAESPAGSFTNTYNLVSIDWVTGRARIERQEVR